MRKEFLSIINKIIDEAVTSTSHYIKLPEEYSLIFFDLDINI